MSDFKNIILKMIISLLIVQVVIMPISNEVRAASFWENVTSGGDSFLEEGKNSADTDGAASDEKTAEIIDILYNSLLTLGVIITVAVGGILGIKFMTSSAEDKAKIKESMVPYVAGSIVIFGAFGIWKLAIQIFSNI